MSRKEFAIELGGGAPSQRRLREALDLAAGLAAFEHGVSLILHASALARIGGAREDDDLRAALDALAEFGVGPALTDMPAAPERLGALTLVSGDPAPVRARADAVLVF